MFFFGIFRQKVGTLYQIQLEFLNKHKGKTKIMEIPGIRWRSDFLKILGCGLHKNWQRAPFMALVESVVHGLRAYWLYLICKDVSHWKFLPLHGDWKGKKTWNLMAIHFFNGWLSMGWWTKSWNDQTSIFNWLFGAPGTYYTPGAQMTLVFNWN